MTTVILKCLAAAYLAVRVEIFARVACDWVVVAPVRDLCLKAKPSLEYSDKH